MILGKPTGAFILKDSRQMFCGAPEKGTGKSKNHEPNNIFSASGVPFPPPIRYQFEVDGAGKPEVHRKGRAI